MPPPCLPSKQCENIFFTFLAEASCESIEVFDCPNPRIPSSAWSDESRSPDCLAPQLTCNNETMKIICKLKDLIVILGTYSYFQFLMKLLSVLEFGDKRRQFVGISV